MTVLEIVKEIIPYLSAMLCMVGIWFGGMLVGKYNGREETRKSQRVVFVVLGQDGKISAVSQSGNRISFISDCEVKTAEVPNAND